MDENSIRLNQHGAAARFRTAEIIRAEPDVARRKRHLTGIRVGGEGAHGAKQSDFFGSFLD